MRKTTTLSILGIAAVAALTLAARSHDLPSAPALKAHQSQELTTQAPYRDGLFQGRLAAERGASMAPVLSRWSDNADRAVFVLGYSRGYSAVKVDSSTSQR